MKAMVLHDWKETYRLEERPEPSPGIGEAVMRVRAAGVGLTLVNMRLGRLGGSLPRVMGHELAGEIVEIGEGVTALAVGDRCAVYFYLTCGRCRWCRGGRETLCENFGGYVGGHRDGGFAEFVCLPEGNFLPISDGLSDEAAAVATDAVNTNWHCMRERARIDPHDTVLLIGRAAVSAFTVCKWRGCSARVSSRRMFRTKNSIWRGNGGRKRRSTFERSTMSQGRRND